MAQVRLGTAELVMRLQEEQRRRNELLEYSEGLTFERMSGPAGEGWLPAHACAAWVQAA